MNFFQTKMIWSNSEFIPFKLCVASFYLFVGSYFHNFIKDYYTPVLIIFGITMIWTMTLWIKKMKESKEQQKL